MSDPVKTYRVYCYDAAQSSLSVVEIEARSDEQAIALAEAQGFGSKCEIWDGDRLVAQLDEEERRQA